MKTRIELQEQLETVLGSNQVYFQPPSNVQMKYPAIVYELSGELINKANNKRYTTYRKYTITHIYKSTSLCLMDKILDAFTFIEFDRRLIADGLYQDVYTIYW
jgi:hypothetical protein